MGLFEKDGDYHLVAEILGLKKEDISITVEKDILMVSGKKEATTEKRMPNIVD
ncbi:Hsp20/alpha crystallin family protein [Thermodesulfobacteriota bacterium]